MEKQKVLFRNKMPMIWLRLQLLGVFEVSSYPSEDMRRSNIMP